MEKARRVVFFDSGVGGLSVYRDVKKLNPAVEGYYIFDNECFPYGTKTPEFLEERVCSILRRMRELYAPAAVVIARNTASTAVLPQVRAAPDIPVRCSPRLARWAAPTRTSSSASTPKAAR